MDRPARVARSFAAKTLDFYGYSRGPHTSAKTPALRPRISCVKRSCSGIEGPADLWSHASLIQTPFPCFPRHVVFRITLLCDTILFDVNHNLVGSSGYVCSYVSLRVCWLTDLGMDGFKIDFVI